MIRGADKRTQSIKELQIVTGAYPRIALIIDEDRHRPEGRSQELRNRIGCRHPRANRFP